MSGLGRRQRPLSGLPGHPKSCTARSSPRVSMPSAACAEADGHTSGHATRRAKSRPTVPKSPSPGSCCTAAKYRNRSNRPRPVALSMTVQRPVWPSLTDPARATDQKVARARCVPGPSGNSGQRRVWQQVESAGSRTRRRWSGPQRVPNHRRFPSSERGFSIGAPRPPSLAVGEGSGSVRRHEVSDQLRFDHLRVDLMEFFPGYEELVASLELPDVPAAPMANWLARSVPPVLVQSLTKAACQLSLRRPCRRRTT